mmetsp:Transcript_7519/g.8490  ORF Transcript_7519/g.8490 Transcript_7519/m.8490 type:complete len:81 (+) Transcript_7519:469-711(+)
MRHEKVDLRSAKHVEWRRRPKGDSHEDVDEKRKKGNHLKRKILSAPVEEMTDERLKRFAVFQKVNKKSKAIFQLPQFVYE